MNYIYTTVNTIRDRYTPARNKSSFRQTGEITPEEFVKAGDYLGYKFPSWRWSEADNAGLEVPYLPPDKQFLVTYNVPSFRRWNLDFAGYAGHEEAIVGEGEEFRGTAGKKAKKGADGDDPYGWLRTGGVRDPQPTGSGQVREVDDGGEVVGDADMDDDDEEEGVPNMEEDDDEDAIIREDAKGAQKNSRRSYNLYIMYSTFYRTPRLYLAGHDADGNPLPPRLMMDDIVGDYKDKTVTVEPFPFFKSDVKLVSIHPCKHAPVMKSLLDLADVAWRNRRERQERRRLNREQVERDNGSLAIREALRLRVLHPESADVKDEWEEVKRDDAKTIGEDGLRVDQYMIVFLKFMASVTPGIAHDFTMAVDF